MKKMKQAASTVKTTATTIAKVPQTIGHAMLKKKDKQWWDDDWSEATAEDNELHKKICSNVIDDQHARSTVDESRDECLREITDHLKLFLFQKSDANPAANERYEYEEWIMALHPDNVHPIGSGRALIDYRFYIADSHHRQLWNEYMVKMECKESIVKAESRSNVVKSFSLIDTLLEEPEELCSTITESFCYGREN